MNETTIIVGGKEFLKGKTQNGRPWFLAKVLDGETGQWFATFDVGSVFQDIRFKELCNGDLLRIQYEEKQKASTRIWFSSPLAGPSSLKNLPQNRKIKVPSRMNLIPRGQEHRSPRSRILPSQTISTKLKRRF